MGLSREVFTDDDACSDTVPLCLARELAGGENTPVYLILKRKGRLRSTKNVAVTCEFFRIRRKKVRANW